MAFLWPGLPQLWTRGSWAGLLVAVGFTALANVLLLATLVYHEWLPQQTRLIGYAALALVWLLSRLRSRAERRAIPKGQAENVELEEGTTEQPPAARDEQFRNVQGHYLRNDWVATEQGLLKLLKQDARDIESRLMLATLWRHQGRAAEATRQLDRLERLEAAASWQHEIAAERMALAELDEANLDEANNEANEPRSAAPPERTELTEEDQRHDDELRRAA